MSEAINSALFGWYSYLCLTVFLVGSLIRFDREQYTWRSGSSQLLRRRQLMWAGRNPKSLTCEELCPERGVDACPEAFATHGSL